MSWGASLPSSQLIFGPKPDMGRSPNEELFLEISMIDLESIICSQLNHPTKFK